MAIPQTTPKAPRRAMTPAEFAKVWWRERGQYLEEEREKKRQKKYLERQKAQRRDGSTKDDASGRREAAKKAVAASEREWRAREEMQRIADDYDGQIIRREAAATGEPLVTGLPKKFAGQLTEAFGGCWRWHGEYRPARGLFVARPIYRGEFVYRVLYVELFGPIEPGKQLHHRCYRGWCANPWHTEPLTRDEHIEKHTPSIAWLRAAGMSF
jgi:hypothetical protein